MKKPVGEFERISTGMDNVSRLACKQTVNHPSRNLEGSIPDILRLLLDRLEHRFRGLDVGCPPDKEKP